MNALQLNEVSESINKLLSDFNKQKNSNLISAKSKYSFVELLDVSGKFIDNEFFDYAEKLLNLLYSIEPDSSILSRLAFCQKKLNKIEEAKKSYEKAIKLSSDSHLLHYNYAVLLQEIGEFKSAIEKYNSALQLNPVLAEAHYNLGNILLVNLFILHTE